MGKKSNVNRPTDAARRRMARRLFAAAPGVPPKDLVPTTAASIDGA